MNYIHQHPGFALGNFINCTPTIMRLFVESGGTPVKVLFETDYVKQCYLDSPYIEHIDTPNGNRLFGSDMTNRRANAMTDQEYIEAHVCGNYSAKFKTFIDQPKPFINHKYGVFVNGAGSENPEYLNRKLVNERFQIIVDESAIIPIYGTGSLNDEKRNIFRGFYGDIRESLALINGADWIITNATGFYHAAGAMNKRQLALWKHCQRPRNENLNKNQTIAISENWEKEIQKFLA